MDNFESPRHDQGKEDALRAALNGAQTLVACPDWCSWSLLHPAHDHVAQDGAELVVASVWSWVEHRHVDTVLEARHTVAPSAPCG